jgi:hypothetical protein
MEGAAEVLDADERIALGVPVLCRAADEGDGHAFRGVVIGRGVVARAALEAVAAAAV